MIMPLTITLDCTACHQRKLMTVSLLDLGKYQPREEKQGRRKQLVYSGICLACALQREH